MHLCVNCLFKRWITESLFKGAPCNSYFDFKDVKVTETNKVDVKM